MPQASGGAGNADGPLRQEGLSYRVGVRCSGSSHHRLWQSSFETWERGSRGRNRVRGMNRGLPERVVPWNPEKACCLLQATLPRPTPPPNSRVLAGEVRCSPTPDAGRRELTPASCPLFIPKAGLSVLSGHRPQRHLFAGSSLRSLVAL